MADFDVRAFRNALGAFPTGICVVTTMRDGTVPFGMTVNSFASVSLDPALVLWSIQCDSDCFPIFEANESFAISVLTAEQQALSNQYSKRGEHDLNDGDYIMGESGMPLISNALATFECKVWQRCEGGDHVIIIGSVQAFSHEADKKPLIFNSGKYAELA